MRLHLLCFNSQITLMKVACFIVGQVGIEPTQPEGNRFTVCPASPTAALTHNASCEATLFS